MTAGIDIDSFWSGPHSRRRFFRAAGVSVAGASAVLLTACASDGDGGDDEDSGDAADIELLNSALDLELMAVAAYKSGAARLRGDLLDMGQKFLEQEQAHVEALTSAIEDLGGTPNRARSSYDFPRLRGERDTLRFALDLENTAIAAYIDALPKLSGAELRATGAAIVTNEAEHAAVLLGALDLPQLSAAFVTGRAV